MQEIDYITITVTFADGKKRRCLIRGEDLEWAEEQMVLDRLGEPSRAWAWCEGYGV